MKRSSYLALSALIISLSCVSSYADGDAPKRIVSLSPNLTQIIYALGAWDRMVGVTIYSEFPPDAKTLPKVGGWINPSYEAIVALKPDLVVLVKDQQSSFGDKLRNLGLKTFVVNNNDSIKDILKSISDLGEVLGKEEEAKSLNAYIKTSLSEISKKARKKKKVRALIVIGRNPGTLEDLYVIGTGNYIDELLKIAGGENAVQSERFAIKITKETVFSFNPEVIFDIDHRKPALASTVKVEAKGVGEQNENLDMNIWRNKLNQVDAVRNNAVYKLPSDSLLHPSHRIVEGAKVLYQALHSQ